MGRLTTHVLDTMHGRPAAGVRIEMYSRAAPLAPLVSTVTNADGRCAAALLEAPALAAGRYELVFHVGDYFRGMGVVLPDPPFLDDVIVRIGIANPDQHYHVPLLVSPWSYSTYRGS